MPRPLRIEYPNAWYHVMNRGAGRRKIFRNDNHRKIFLSCLEEACRVRIPKPLLKQGITNLKNPKKL